MVKYMPSTHYNKGEIVFREGDISDCVYLICSGQVGIYTKNNEGKDIQITKLDENSIFGEMGVIDDSPRSATVKAESDLWCYVFNRQAFDKKLHDLDPFMAGIFRVLVNTVREMNNKYK